MKNGKATGRVPYEFSKFGPDSTLLALGGEVPESFKISIIFPLKKKKAKFCIGRTIVQVRYLQV